MKIESRTFLPVEIVFHPNWWHHETGLTFDRGYFFDSGRRVKDEMLMKRTMWEHFGNFDYGEEHQAPEPVIGPVHLADGFMMTSLWGAQSGTMTTTVPLWNRDCYRLRNWMRWRHPIPVKITTFVISLGSSGRSRNASGM